MTKVFWNGEQVTAVRGTVIVADAPGKPMYWATIEGIIGQRISVVRVSRNTWMFTLDDRGDSGWRKITEGRGMPLWGHRTIHCEPDSFEETAS